MICQIKRLLLTQKWYLLWHCQWPITWHGCGGTAMLNASPTNSISGNCGISPQFWQTSCLSICLKDGVWGAHQTLSYGHTISFLFFYSSQFLTNETFVGNLRAIISLWWIMWQLFNDVTLYSDESNSQFQFVYSNQTEMLLSLAQHSHGISRDLIYLPSSL